MNRRRILILFQELFICTWKYMEINCIHEFILKYLTRIDYFKTDLEILLIHVAIFKLVDLLVRP